MQYDSQWRRRTKSVYAWDAQTETWVLERSHLFLYDQWNLIHEVIADHTQTPAVAIAKTYTWGLDLSQTIQGAGGVGGLLAVTCHSTPATCHFFCYDGNGNVVALVSAADGSVTARYDYSPFGETLSATGSVAGANPFRFSTKYADVATGLAYYGFRYFAGTTGRWLARDALGESAGAGIYAFVGNRSALMVDILGLADKEGLSAEQWLAKWKEAHTVRDPRDKANIDKRILRILDFGCVGAVMVRLGMNVEERGRKTARGFTLASDDHYPENRKDVDCYPTVDKALARVDERNGSCPCKGKNVDGKPSKPQVFSVHFRDKVELKPAILGPSNPTQVTGRLVARGWHGMDGGPEFDYGFVTNLEDSMLARKTDPAKAEMQIQNAVTVNEAYSFTTMRGQDWEREYTSGAYKTEVWCVACERRDLTTHLKQEDGATRAAEVNPLER